MSHLPSHTSSASARVPSIIRRKPIPTESETASNTSTRDNRGQYAAVSAEDGDDCTGSAKKVGSSQPRADNQFALWNGSHLASFGALLALTTLAVDPFPQASVSMKHCEHVTGHVASIPRTNSYTRNIALTGTHANAPDAGMQLAIYWGVLEPPDNSSVSIPSTLDCLTDNCTFPAEQGASFTSLAMCAYAWDVSDYIDGEMVDERRDFSLGPGLFLWGHLNTTYVTRAQTEGLEQ
ncbi:uncharacterized protein G6M90_00g026750 [Metarhizium brunneum]|uniref:Uncharacterized protein n=1 Tax=Metarhizium brunneum TaxID=500148 RepID=A0A7D5UR16_9HYPO|nr:hypothetical protein G6M90_00g026750 [Metarhizium brunneum]